MPIQPSHPEPTPPAKLPAASPTTGSSLASDAVAAPKTAGSPLGKPNPAPFLASIALHVILLTAMGLIWGSRSGGTGGEPDRPIGIAVVQRLPDRDRYVEATQVEPQQETEQSESAASSSAAAPPADLAPPIDLDGILKQITDTPVPTAGSGLAGDNPLGGDSFGSGPGQGTASDPSQREATLFGISGYGSKFLYVMDRSDSMNGYGGRPLKAAKSELARSLNSLTERQMFQIIFYNDRPIPFQASGGPPQLITGGSTMVDAATRYVKSVRAFGGTEHDTALKLALRMQPDVIFFLTDARIPRLSGSQLNDIRSRAARAGTTIHTIEFGTDPGTPADSFLIDLAKQNGGQYQYVNVQQL